MLSKSGIYKITCTVSGKVYIGSSINVRKRRNHHLCYLRKNRHSNNYLQHSYNKYGEDSLVFEMVEECEPELLLVTEEKCINKFNSFNDGFNLVEKPTAHMLGYKHTDEAKAIMSAAAKARGRVHGALTPPQVKEIRKRFFNGERNSTLAQEFKVNRKTIRECVYLITYQDIPCEIEGYSEMIENLREERKNGVRTRSRGWKQSEEFVKKLKKINSQPKKNRKFSDEQVREIRTRKEDGESYRKLAKEFGVSVATIQMVVQRTAYKDVD